MKILIAADMEGISGVVDWTHVDHTHGEYGRFRSLMTADINAAIRGATKGGADDIVVTDGHGTKSNILIEELDHRARLICGSSSPFSMVQGIADNVQAAMFVGYHARAGAGQAILSHTISSAKVADIIFNGRSAGEIGMNASLCGSYGVPVVMVSSDVAGCAEAQEWIPGVITVATKTASGRMAAECLSPQKNAEMIEAAAEKAVKAYLSGKATLALKTVEPVKVNLQFLTPVMADAAAVLPGNHRLDGRTIEFTAKNTQEAYLWIRSSILMAG